MSERDIAEAAVAHNRDELPLSAGEHGSPRPRWRRVLKRVAIGIGMTVLVIVLLVVALYSFGGMERPTPQNRTAFAAMVAQGAAAPVESRFVIPIPGCRCHSDDPVQQVRHASYRIKECRACH